MITLDYVNDTGKTLEDTGYQMIMFFKKKVLI